jgi:hypothetical protein
MGGGFLLFDLRIGSRIKNWAIIASTTMRVKAVAPRISRVRVWIFTIS